MYWPFWTALLMILIPTRWALKLDRRTGYRIYQSAPDEATGLWRAGLFYRFIGLGFLIFGLVQNPDILKAMGL